VRREHKPGGRVFVVNCAADCSSIAGVGGAGFVAGAVSVDGDAAAAAAAVVEL
jgi:hypothetical protein